ncbi:hypothetical protein DNTS_002588 [Danionella cerebrum]|uniref:Uncharacterized protein n=1 Tax=Danionella cerebrum TaxID=2873325 RepID=A0A553RHC0_9TELE|nr:hypothetical protein DNTS_002588 [Danionella translucida]
MLHLRFSRVLRELCKPNSRRPWKNPTDPGASSSRRALCTQSDASTEKVKLEAPGPGRQMDAWWAAGETGDLKNQEASQSHSGTGMAEDWADSWRRRSLTKCYNP